MNRQEVEGTAEGEEKVGTAETQSAQRKSVVFWIGPGEVEALRDSVAS